MAQTLHYSNHHALNIAVDNQSTSTPPTIMTNTPQQHNTGNVRGQQNMLRPESSHVGADEASTITLHQEHQQGSAKSGRVSDPRPTSQNASKKRAEVEWTSFTHDSEAEDTPESRRRFSESEHRNLLADDYDQLSEDDDPESCSPPRQQQQNSQPCTSSSSSSSLEITPQLKNYYCEQFEKLYKIVNGEKSNKNDKKMPQHYDSKNCKMKKNQENDGSTSEDDLGRIAKGALKGTDPRVQEFFRKSKLDQSQLSKIWSLADVNTDGYLNLHEFIVAMHLIVRYVKGKCEIPDELPTKFRPPVTPPRSSDDENDQESDWATSAPSQQLPPTPAASQPSLTSKQDQKFVQQDQQSESPPTQFTSQPPVQSAHISHPVARRFSPDVAPKRPLAQQPQVVLLSPQTLNPPKGPPPKPPPRPPVQTRHTRSVSLDLNKNRFSPPENLQQKADFEPVANEGSPHPICSLRSDAETQTVQHHQSDTISASSNDPAMTTSSLLIDESTPLSAGPTAARTPADRCQLLKTTNDQFERELARLVEIRLKLQIELKHFENGGKNSTTKN
uniref:Uncharacterized protein n=1 Tax=Romanomermis culicivorax TaxID=13658 RepID=A0A915HE18_ROMCU